MFSSLRNIVAFQTRNGDYSTTHLLSSLLLQNQFLRITIRRSISSVSSKNHRSSSSSFVVSYLVNSCGLSEDKAISASNKLHFRTSSRPNSVLTLLEDSGFTKPYISKLIVKLPSVLLADPHKTLKPKIDFFNSVGLSGIDLANLLSKDPTSFLGTSLENKIIPTFGFLKSILHTDENVIATVKRSSRVLKYGPATEMVPNFELLRDQGVPESKMLKFIMKQPGVITINAERFKEIVEEIKKMGFKPLETSFLTAIKALTSMSKSNWEAKSDVYRRWGWSEEDILTAFRKKPSCLMASEKKIMGVMDFFVNQMGYNPSLMAHYPCVFSLSLEKRTIPRYRVIRILISKGLIVKNVTIDTVMIKLEKLFLERYVIKYEKEVPQLLKVYQGQLDCDLE